MPDTENYWYVYLLRCRDGRLYTGITPDLEKRVRAHEAGRGCDFTRRRLPVRLIYAESHPSKSLARKREMQIKKWGQRKKRSLVADYRGFPRVCSG